MLAAPSLPPRSNPAQGQGSYRRHTPEDTALYALVDQYLTPFLDFARERNGRPLAMYVPETSESSRRRRAPSRSCSVSAAR